MNPSNPQLRRMCRYPRSVEPRSSARARSTGVRITSRSEMTTAATAEVAPTPISHRAVEVLRRSQRPMASPAQKYVNHTSSG